ncbi:hypothetical protein U14_04939 [Candidatus Moduliflexus flocculans]|uniref:DUF2232 domain-containing protein n=1 Tax=Candidatus Moduliflexus flocculans TaxID=1499966 RepID=A0A0S6W1H6_9BACT|nr:hypothetical protein U14_04939 [Candidatus Moduliflexus flocculans]
MGGIFLLSVGIAAIILTLGFLRKWPTTTTICSVCCFLVIVCSAILPENQREYLVAQTKAMAETLSSSFFARDEQTQFDAQIEAVLVVVITLEPLMTALMISGILYSVIRLLLKIQQVPIEPHGQFSEWEISEHCLWVIIFAGGLYHFQATQAIGLNLLVGVVLLYYLQGSSLVIFFLKQRQVSKGMQQIAYGLFFLQIPSVFLLVGLLLTGYREKGMALTLVVIFIITGMGLANVWYGFRKRIKGESAG